MTPEQRDQLMRLPYRIGGRGKGAIDCLGVVLYVLRANGRAELDPWHNLVRAYRQQDLEAAHAFPSNWQRVHDHSLQHLDVLLYHESHSWSAIVDNGQVYSAHPNVGVWARDVQKLAKLPHEVWRQAC